MKTNSLNFLCSAPLNKIKRNICKMQFLDELSLPLTLLILICNLNYYSVRGLKAPQLCAKLFKDIEFGGKILINISKNVWGFRFLISLLIVLYNQGQ